MYFILKAAVSGLIVAAASALGRKYPLWGAVLVSIPLVSLLTAIWMNVEAGDLPRISKFLRNVFWAHIPTLVFFLLCPILLRETRQFWLSVVLSLLVTAVCFFLYAALLRRFGIEVIES